MSRASRCVWQLDTTDPVAAGEAPRAGRSTTGDPLLDAHGAGVVRAYPAGRRFFVSGYATGTDALRGTPAVTDEAARRRPCRCLFAFDPVFRGYVEGTERLVGNALLAAPARPAPPAAARPARRAAGASRARARRRGAAEDEAALLAAAARAPAQVLDDRARESQIGLAVDDRDAARACWPDSAWTSGAVAPGATAPARRRAVAPRPVGAARAPRGRTGTASRSACGSGRASAIRASGHRRRGRRLRAAEPATAQRQRLARAGLRQPRRPRARGTSRSSPRACPRGARASSRARAWPSSSETPTTARRRAPRPRVIGGRPGSALRGRGERERRRQRQLQRRRLDARQPAEVGEEAVEREVAVAEDVALARRRRARRRAGARAATSSASTMFSAPST